MMARDSPDLWFRPPTSPSVASEDAGAFGSVCEPVDAVAKKVSQKLSPDLHLQIWADP